MTDRMPPGWENAVLARLLGPPGRDGPVTCRLVTGTPRAEGAREPCDRDDGLRKCCGTRQLGPHAGDCLLTPAARDGMAGHERTYSHETEGAALMCVRCGTGRIAWCTDPYRHGESAEPVSPGDPPVVTETTETFYLLVCRLCGDGDLVMPFGSPGERGKWAAGHTKATGHDRWFVTESAGRLSGEQLAGMLARHDVALRGLDPVAEELRHLAADLLELHEAGALAGVRAVVAERLRQVRGGPAEGIDGRAYQAAELAGEIDRETAS